VSNLVNEPAHRRLLQPRADERDELSVEKQSVIAMPERAKSRAPADFADRDASCTSGKVLGNACSFGGSHGVTP
jgi:hypothetical protein